MNQIYLGEEVEDVDEGVVKIVGATDGELICKGEMIDEVEEEESAKNRCR